MDFVNKPLLLLLLLLSLLLLLLLLLLLKALMLKELEGSKIRSCVQWVEEGKKPTRYFFKLEREHFECNFIFSILKPPTIETST